MKCNCVANDRDRWQERLPTQWFTDVLQKFFQEFLPQIFCDCVFSKDILYFWHKMSRWIIDRVIFFKTKFSRFSSYTSFSLMAILICKKTLLLASNKPKSEGYLEIFPWSQFTSNEINSNKLIHINKIRYSHTSFNISRVVCE